MNWWLFICSSLALMWGAGPTYAVVLYFLADSTVRDRVTLEAEANKNLNYDLIAKIEHEFLPYLIHEDCEDCKVRQLEKRELEQRHFHYTECKKDFNNRYCKKCGYTPHAFSQLAGMRRTSWKTNAKRTNIKYENPYVLGDRNGNVA